MRAQLSVAAANGPFRVLLVVFVVQTVGIATMLAGVNYLAEHVLRRPDDGPTFLFACFVGPAILVMPLWTRLGRRLGKRRALVVASGLLTAGALAMSAAGSVPPAVVYLTVTLAGVGYAGQQVFALAMLPDCIAYDDARTGRRQAGVFTGLWTAGETLGLALGPGVFALVLAVGDYRSATSGVEVVQPDSARTAILLGFTVVPALLIGPVTALLSRYRLTEAALAEALRETTGHAAPQAERLG